MPSLLAALRNEARRAKLDPSALQSFKALRLNQGVSDVIEAMLLSAESWTRAEGDAPATGAYCLGVDIGGSAAMTAAAAYFMDSGRLDAFAMFPAEPGLAERGLSDGVGSAYVSMAARGELTISGQYVPDPRDLLREVLARWGAPAAISGDRYKDGDLLEALRDVAFPVVPMVWRGQGFRDGGNDAPRFQRQVLDGHVTPVKSLLLRSAMMEARVTMDTSGNVKLAKSVQGGRRLRARDDAVAAAILAVAVGSRHRKPDPRITHAVAG